MSAATSPGTGLAYGLQRVCAAWGFARSSFYAMKSRQQATAERPPAKRRGPKPSISTRLCWWPSRPTWRHPPGRARDDSRVVRLRPALDALDWNDMLMRDRAGEPLQIDAGAARGLALRMDRPLD